MKKINNYIIWLFLVLALILFVFNLVVFENSANSKIYPCNNRKWKTRLASKDYKEVEEKIIPLAIWCNRGDSDIYLWVGDHFVRKGNLIESLTYYQKSIELDPFSDYEIYRKVGKIYEHLGKTRERETLMIFLFEKIKKMDNVSGFSTNLAKDFYLTGEKYYKNGEMEKAIYFLDKAMNVFPQSSYFYVELAALYFSNGDFDKAREVFIKCLEFNYPREHCQKYLSDDLKQLNIQSLGYWRKEILAITD